MKNNKGISLIVLVITIIIIIILAGSIILSLASNNPIKKANEAAFKLDIGSFKDQLSLYLLSEFSKNPKFVVANVDATGANMKDYISIMTNKYFSILKIVDGQLIFIGTDPDQVEWAANEGTGNPTPSGMTSFMATLQDTQFKSVIQTDDGGYVCAGSSTSSTLLGYPYNGQDDAVIVKYDNSGNQQWAKGFGGQNQDNFDSVIKVADGYICAGSTVNDTNYSHDGVVVKYDNSGNELWSKTFDRTYDDDFYSITKVAGGFLCAGTTEDSSNYTDNALIVKYDDNGIEQWSKDLVTSNYDSFNSVTEVNDGGYVCAGLSINGSNYSYDGLVVKYNNLGDEQWSKKFIGDQFDIFNSVVKVSDGFICAGKSGSSDVGFTPIGNEDAIIVKYNDAGEQQWAKNFGGSDSEGFSSILKVSNGFICVGESFSTDAGFTANGYEDAVIVKYNDAGEQQWVKGFGGIDHDSFASVAELSNGFVAVGKSNEYFTKHALSVRLVNN